jgi:hypothetical protein
MVFLNVMPDIQDGRLRTSVVKEMRLEQKPLHSDEGDMVVLEDEML